MASISPACLTIDTSLLLIACHHDRYPFKQCKRKFYFNCKKKIAGDNSNYKWYKYNGRILSPRSVLSVRRFLFFFSFFFSFFLSFSRFFVPPQCKWKRLDKNFSHFFFFYHNDKTIIAEIKDRNRFITPFPRSSTI